MTVTITTRPNIGSSGLIEVIDGIEFVGFGSGGFGDDDLLIIGDEVDNILAGDSGHDLIEGEGGQDTITGGDGNDTLGGNEGDDDIDGQEGTDKLFGDAGNDILRAGHGHDILQGGSGNDTFGFYALGHFEVTDFTLGEDRLFFDSERTGIDNIEELIQLITSTSESVQNVNGQNQTVTHIEFDNNAASIDLVGASLSQITADMIIFNL